MNELVNKASAPGKIILSGEHAIAHGAPALAMAIHKVATTTISAGALKGVTFSFPNLNVNHALTFDELEKYYSVIDQRYELFKKNKLLITEVLSRPETLIFYTVMHFFKKVQLTLPRKLAIEVSTDIPINCGLGSSAAIIISLLKNLAHLYSPSLTSNTLLKLALDCENLQHGQSSGLDLYMAHHGGCYYFERKEDVQTNSAFCHPTPLELTPNILNNFIFVNTGTAQSHTGECVMAAQPYFDPLLVNKFAHTTLQFKEGLQSRKQETLLAAVRSNHALLTQIGVVPKKIQQFISLLEENSGAGKICGAGSIRGEQAGILLVLSALPSEKLNALCDEFGYAVEPIQ